MDREKAIEKIEIIIRDGRLAQKLPKNIAIRIYDNFFRKQGVCRWRKSEAFTGNIYKTSCGHLYNFKNGGPLENDFYFCPFPCCGNRIEIEENSDD